MEVVPEPELPTTVWADLGIGLALALLALSVPLVGMAPSALLTILHELGHAAAGWLYGYPSLPAFDLRYGGGVTTHAAQSLPLVLLVYGLLLGALSLLRANPRGRVLAGAALVGYAATAHAGVHHALVIAAGHGSELVLAGVFLYRALTGAALVHEAERPLYAGLGLYVVLRGCRLAWGLLTSQAARNRYGAAKGGGHWMDFSRLARDHLGVSLEVVAGAFLVACLLTPLLAWGAARTRTRWGEALREALEVR